MTGKNIRAGFCENNRGCGLDESYPAINGKISADNAACFDKWSKCPLCLPIPENDKQRQFVLKQLSFWASDVGYKLSNEFEYEQYVKSYPMTLKQSLAKWQLAEKKYHDENKKLMEEVANKLHYLNLDREDAKSELFKKVHQDLMNRQKQDAPKKSWDLYMLDWECDKSPIGICVGVGEDTDGDCIYCGQPDERK